MLLSRGCLTERNYPANRIRLAGRQERQDGRGSINPGCKATWTEAQELGFGMREEDVARREGPIHGVRGS